MFDQLLQDHLGLVKPELNSRQSAEIPDVPDFVLEQIRAVEESGTTNFNRPGLLAGNANVLRTVKGDIVKNTSSDVFLRFDLTNLSSLKNEIVTAVELKV